MRISPLFLKALAVVGVSVALLLGVGAQTLTHQVDTGGGYSAATTADVSVPFAHRLQYNFPSSGVAYSNASIVTQLPANVEYLSKGTTSHIDNSVYDAGTHSVTFNFISTLPSNFSGEVFVNVRFPGGTFTGTVAANNATLNWDADSVPASLTSAPDVQVTATNGAVGPTISNGIDLQPWVGADPVYIGSGVYYGIRHGSLGGEEVTNYVIEQSFPPEFIFEYWRHRETFLTPLNFAVSFTTSTDLSWQNWPGGPFSSSDDARRNVTEINTLAPGTLAAGEYLTALRFDYGSVAAGMDYHIDQGAYLFVMGEVTTKNVDSLPNDVNGTAVVVTDVLSSTVTLSTDNYSDSVGVLTATVEPDIATVDVELDYVTSSPFNPNEVVRVRLTVQSPPENVLDLVNPTVVNLLPAEMEYVGNVTTGSNTSLVMPVPNIAPIESDFDGTGRDFLKFFWDSSNPLTVSPTTEWEDVYVYFDVRIASATADGTYNNAAMGWLENASFDCQDDHTLVDTNDFDLDLDRTEELCGKENPFEVFRDSATASATIIVSDAIVSESSASAIVSVSLTALSGTDITVDYATADGTATAGSDYTAKSGTLTIPAGSISVDIVIDLLEDFTVEGAERFFVDLTNPVGAPLVDSQADVTLNDNDSAVLSVADTAVTESATTVSVTVSISNPSTSAVSVDYATADGSATAGSDYTATSGTAVIAAGATSTMISVALLDGATAEGTEAFVVDLANPVGATISDSQATITIHDNDSVTPPGNAYFLQQNTNTIYAVDLATGAPTFLANTSVTGNMNGMAYDEENGRLWYMDGITYELYAFDIATTTEVGIIADLDAAGWTDPLSGGFADGAAWYDGAFYVGTASSDNLYKVTFNATFSAVADVVKVADINGNSGNTAWGDFSISQSGVLYGADAITGAILSYDIVAGGPRQEVAAGVPVNGALLGGNGTLYGIQSNATNGPLYTIDLVTGTSAFHANTGLATSPGDLAGPVVPGPVGAPVEFSVIDAVVAEGGASVNVTIQLSAFSSSNVSVSYATADGSALAGSDYAAASGIATVLAGNGNVTFGVPILEDSVAEGLETFLVNLTNPSVGTTIEDNQAVITVNDNDSVSMSIVDTSVGESGSSVNVTIQLSNLSTTVVSVDYATANGSALAGSDYTSTTGNATIAANALSTTISVPILEDGLFEGDENFFVNLTNPSSGTTILDSQATVTVSDNDTTSLSIADTNVTEGTATVDVTISLATPSATAVQVDYVTVNGTATAGSDYTATNGTATIPAGATSTVVTVSILDDITDEGSEAFAVSLSNPMGAPIIDNQALVTLNDNDTSVLSVVDTSAAESAGSVDVTIQLSNPSVNDVQVDYETKDQSADDGKDYQYDNGTVTILAGDTTATVTINLIDDSKVEGSETFRIEIDNASGATIAGDRGVVTIFDDDDTEISIVDVVVSEGAGTAILTVLLTNPSDFDIDVNFATANGSAESGSDYLGSTGTVIVKAGNTSEILSISLIDDSAFERNEDFKVRLSGAVGATITDNEADVIILDNECDETPFLIQTADLHGVDFENATTNLLASNIAAYSINAIGYNRRDHFLWGFKQVAPWDTVVRINADYSVSEFAIPGLSADSYHIGDVDEFGVLHLGRAFSKVVKRVDVNPNSPNYLKLLPDLLLSDDDSWGDWAFHALDGNLYSIDRSEKLFRINPLTGLVTELGNLSGVRASGYFGACYCDGDGAFYALREQNGIIYRLPDVHLLTGATKPDVEFFSKAPSGWSSDGARCASAQPPAGPLRVNVDDAFVTENLATVTVTIRLTSANSSAVSVDYTTLNNTATSGTDYVAKSGKVTFPAGSTQQTVSVALVADTLPEGQESFFVTISNPTGGVILADDAGIVSITDDDATDTDRDGTPDVDDIDDDDDGILDVDEALVNATCPNNVEVIILLDNSGSISASEWDSFSAFTRDVIDELGASGTVRMAVAHYWSDWLGIQSELYLESDFTTDPNAAKLFDRRGIGRDELHRTIPLLRNALSGTGTGVNGGSTTLTHLPGSEVHVLFMTDAAKTLFGNSDLVDPSTPGDPYKFMNDFKTDFGVTVTGVRFDTGSAASDAEANAAVAALSSVGGVYTGTIDANATDPEGSGVIPRRFYNVNNFSGISATLAAELADLTCESTQDFDGDGFPDHLDIDSDNDGIPDNVEAQSTEGYLPPNGDAGPINSGLDSAYIGGLIPVDSDGDAVPDVYDADSDNDGTSDVTENADSDNSASGSDLDKDGLDNAFDSENVVWDINDHIDDPNPTTLGDVDGDLAPNGDNATAMFRDVDFRDPGKQTVYGNWKTLYDFVLGAENGPDDNPDRDLYDNLLEYALCLHPGTGLPGPGGFFLEADISGGIHAKFYRPKGGISDVSYEIHGRSDLPIIETETWSIMFTIPGNGTPGSGITVTDFGNAIEEVRISNLESFSPVTPQSGFIRLAVTLGNQTSYAPIWGWTETVVEATHSETYSNPFMMPELLSGEIDAIVGTHGIDLSTATGGVPLHTELSPGVFGYYIEIIEGDHAGHRFDVDSVNGSTVTLKADSDVFTGPPYNTLVTPVSIPSTLVGDRFILRAHTTLEDFFPPSGFTPQAHTLVTGHPADRVYLYDDGDWDPYWLYDNATGNGPFWDQDGDAVFVDAGRKAIPPGGGVFLSPQETTVTLMGLGIVRKNPFAMPLPKGWSLQASPFPLDQGPAERFMNQNTFDGSDDPASADTVCFWLGNGDTYVPEFRCAFLFDPKSTETPRWLYADDEFLTPRDFDSAIFPRDRSSFYFRYNASKPEYMVPLPWCIDLIGE